MSEANLPKPNPSLDLVLTKESSLPVELVWKALTTPDLIKQWFCPKPWVVADCELELWPGGKFYTAMQSPDGDQFPGSSCVLEVVENKRFVWSSALLPGFRPSIQQGGDSGSEMFLFTAVIELESTLGGSIYRATALHADEESKKRHEGMGFEAGWGAAFDQLVALMSE